MYQIRNENERVAALVLLYTVHMHSKGKEMEKFPHTRQSALSSPPYAQHMHEY